MLSLFWNVFVLIDVVAIMLLLRWRWLDGFRLIAQLVLVSKCCGDVGRGHWTRDDCRTDERV